MWGWVLGLGMAVVGFGTYLQAHIRREVGSQEMELVRVCLLVFFLEEWMADTHPPLCNNVPTDRGSDGPASSPLGAGLGCRFFVGDKTRFFFFSFLSLSKSSLLFGVLDSTTLPAMAMAMTAPDIRSYRTEPGKMGTDETLLTALMTA